MNHRRLVVAISLGLSWASATLAQQAVGPAPPQAVVTTAPGEPTVDAYCADPANGSDHICEALKSGQCPAGILMSLCEKKIQRGWLEPFLEKVFGDNAFRDAAATLCIAVLSALVAFGRSRLKKLQDRLGDPLFKRPGDVEHETRGVNVVLVGEGGSGKTSIIRALCGCSHADPAKSSKYFDAYTVVHEVDVRRDDKQIVRALTRIYIEDYEGQKTRHRVHHPAVRLREAAIPSTVLVLVVDLFPPPDIPTDNVPQSRTWDEARVSFHDAQYPEAMIDALSGISAACKHVVLFINKADLISPFSAQTKRNILERYQQLQVRVRAEFSGVGFTVIVGAAATGWGITGFNPDDRNHATLLELIVRAAVPIDMAVARKAA